MDKYEVGFNGHKIVFATSFDNAKQSVEKDLKTIHPNLNAEFSYVTKLEEEKWWTRISTYMDFLLAFC